VAANGQGDERSCDCGNWPGAVTMIPAAPSLTPSSALMYLKYLPGEGRHILGFFYRNPRNEPLSKMGVSFSYRCVIRKQNFAAVKRGHQRNQLRIFIYDEIVLQRFFLRIAWTQ